MPLSKTRGKVILCLPSSHPTSWGDQAEKSLFCRFFLIISSWPHYTIEKNNEAQNVTTICDRFEARCRCWSWFWGEGWKFSWNQYISSRGDSRVCAQAMHVERSSCWRRIASCPRDECNYFYFGYLLWNWPQLQLYPSPKKAWICSII